MRSQKSEVRSQNKNGIVLALLFFGVMCLRCSALAQEPPAPSAASAVLTEVEQLKGENLTLRLDSMDKQMRLMQEQYLRLQEQQAATVKALQTLEAEMLVARSLKRGEWVVNWQEKRIQKAEAGSGKPEAGSKEPEGKKE